MSMRWSSRALSVLVVALSFLGTAVASASGAVSRPATSKCTHTVLSPFVQRVREAASTFVADLAAFGGTHGAISDITITLADGTKVNVAFSGRRFTLRGTDVSAACKAVTAPDGWTF